MRPTPGCAASTKAVGTWREQAAAVTAPSNTELPSDAQVIGAVQRAAPEDAIVVCAAGGLPGELHKLWQARQVGTYHLEYGYSCMGYEIAGGLGVKLARPEREVIVLVGDGSYLMLNSEIATSVMLGLKLTIVVLDNGGFGCIDRLQRATGGEAFNNLLADCGAPRGGFPRACGEPRRAGGTGRWHRRPRSRPAPRLRCAAHQRGGSPHRSAHRHRGGRALVGCRRAGSIDAARR